MTDVNKAYVKTYIEQAANTDDEAIRNDALYRAGTQLEVIPCDGDTNLTLEKKEAVILAAIELLGGDND
jgi:hypothetical protein